MSVLYEVPAIKTELTESDELENAQIVIVRKKTKFADTKQVLGQISLNQQPTPKKRRVSDGASTKVKPPPAVAVARRNARERNRVKQVNNGFSMLRDHIPKEIAETFEQAGRGSAKKLSKVETLRMAVEYIRSLERMLALDTSNDSCESSFTFSNNNNNDTSTFSTMSDASLPATPPPESQQPFFYALKPHSGVEETQITIVGGQQYVRIPGTNTFQLVTPDLFENEENVQPSGEYTTTTIQIHPPQSMGFDASVINAAHAKTPAGSISPYSGHSSLSPAPSHVADNIGTSAINEDGRVSCVEASDQKLPFNEHLMMHCSAADASHYDGAAVMLKQEIIDSDDAIFDESSLSNEHMIDAMQWWEQQQALSHSESP